MLHIFTTAQGAAFRNGRATAILLAFRLYGPLRRMGFALGQTASVGVGEATLPGTTVQRAAMCLAAGLGRLGSSGLAAADRRRPWEPRRA